MELKKYFSKFLLSKRKKNLSKRDKDLHSALKSILGCEVKNIHLYQEAFSLKNCQPSKNASNYERLEFLGDSILGSIISCHLFSTYPDGDEGFLTQMKSKIVSRKNLNKLGEELKLTSFLINPKGIILGENITGNLFEALVGAIYLDLQYEICEKIVLSRLLTPQDMNKLEQKIISYKSLLLEWSQKKKLTLVYKTEIEILPNKQTNFRCDVFLNNKKIANSTEVSKKKAEEKAAQRAFYSLNKKEEILGTSKLHS
ncbi:ribonuclease III [Frigoriflavimonas asaccharolytica]|uniref:Ribonuclease 3 n=1 Tax=Frigoriflavimonas asaccharolytica TaxID=2735899 RepID=A0A8J8K9L6_9FLAO|nr:ribonuclease III [Frigoriflavimonas asaccharolytica]NRS93197.1 ribonuclease-3 [Frigoriflavimonas asaccharolytica]